MVPWFVVLDTIQNIIELGRHQLTHCGKALKCNLQAIFRRNEEEKRRKSKEKRYNKIKTKNNLAEQCFKLSERGFHVSVDFNEGGDVESLTLLL